ncbi:hypothetical protein ABW20_dc0110110 [Dactylellina cionopaga]|nr:hypothetical protein ABW20_dc0110110 [Dactylellina cionopaga]
MEVSNNVTLSSLGFKKLTPLLEYSPGLEVEPPSILASENPQLRMDGLKYDIVMVWGWMNANPRHLIKYLQLHRSLQPGVPILFMKSTTASFIGYTNALRISLPLIYDIVKTLPENPKIFVHTFSNGGTSTFSEFLALYRYETGSAMPAAAILIDSAPGGTKFPLALTRGVNAFMEAVRNPILKAIIYPIVYFLMCILYLPPKLLGIEDPISKMRRILNDETLVAEGSVRGYTYCTGDAMVGWEDILEHADQAEERGWKVMRKGFDGGSHVGAYRHHPLEYEDLVRQLRAEHGGVGK